MYSSRINGGSFEIQYVADSEAGCIISGGNSPVTEPIGGEVEGREITLSRRTDYLSYHIAHQVFTLQYASFCPQSGVVCFVSISEQKKKRDNYPLGLVCRNRDGKCLLRGTD